ncbi:DEAD/DEAH box helicase [Litoribacter ruber]|uniref:DEAD/DEAH box helicase n=1 Tax=Litoribacter ruber TaxID=702568 RepID=UPI001BDB66EE|nr:DEAD/DEAH box helicase [Litoribacter ruber]MBT0812890.1 DEAD/DEAH box helicase [Litoribacter ruber]
MQPPKPSIPIHLIKHLFRCREDIFAVHWKKGSREGYSPAYHIDPYRYRLHKMKGGTFQNFQEKSYKALTDEQILGHLSGQQLIGIYPLLTDNTSFFLTADFDKKDWVSESLAFMEVCKKHNIPAYLERSRSGNGAHGWIFFDRAYPAAKSRKIFRHFLEQAGGISIFEKNSSFDRLFPNQDFLSGKGFGNLIALPFHHDALLKGNSCFVNPSSQDLEPYPNQGEFLASIQKAETSALDILFNSLQEQTAPAPQTNDPVKLEIRLTNSISMKKNLLPVLLRKHLMDELIFTNTEFFVKKKSGRNTYKTPPHFNLIEEDQDCIHIPRGYIGRLIRFCQKVSVSHKFYDGRVKQKEVAWEESIELRPHQHQAIEASRKKDFGIIVAPPGSGKTVVGLKIIAEKRQPALILVHRRQLFDQWTEGISSFLGIPSSEIGRIGNGRTKLGKQVTVAMIQSLGKIMDKEKTIAFSNSVGTLIVDECHHLPADTFREIFSRLKPYFQYGLTATPFRKGNEGKIIMVQLGEIISEIPATEISNYKHPKVVIRNTQLKLPYNPKTDEFEILSNILIHNLQRNELIVRDVIKEITNGHRALIITERTAHIHTLNQLLKSQFETITLSGEDSDTTKKLKWTTLKEGNFQVLITTGQYFGEGSDLDNISALFFAYPFSSRTKLVQYIGRVQRSSITPVVYDFRDQNIQYLDRMFLKRNTYYRKLGREVSLFEDHQIEISDHKLFKFEKTVKVKIEDLEFHFGAISFIYQIPEIGVELDFEVENDDLRPEFNVLKPYFSRILKTKYITAELFAEFEDNVLVSQSAGSKDVEKINQEVIESVKLNLVKQFIQKPYPAPHTKTLLDLDHLHEDKVESLYSSEAELLEKAIADQNVLHSRQLKYLASKHQEKLMKLKFTLLPFSFIFLLKGERQYHLVLETLDTAEATYIWHLDRQRGLEQALEHIEKDLTFIRNHGRQSFLETQPSNFSKITHEYTGDRKGFITWKTLLEERLV